MTTFHMETDAVRAMAAQLRQSSTEIQNLGQILNSTSQAVIWLGPNREQFISELDGLQRQIEGQVAAGTTLAGRVENEVAEWENVAASLGTSHGGEVGAPRDVYRPNMRDVAGQIMNGGDKKIQIYQIGKDEYVVVIQGTEIDLNKSNLNNNWGSAVTTGFGLPSEYQRQVEDAIRKNIPPGATIHMTGHSQGGIVANNLANDSDVYGNYHVASVTTFGSPVSAPETAEVKYVRIATDGDIVPNLEGKDLYSGILTNPFSHAVFPINALGFAGMAGLNLADRSDQINIAGTPWGFVDDHLSYNGNKDNGLENIPASYTIDPKYYRVVMAESANEAESGLAVVQKNLFSGDPLQARVGAIQLPVELTKTFVAGAVTYANGSVSQVLPQNLKAPFDTFNDRMAETIMNVPTEQIVEGGVHMAVNTANYVGNAAGSAANVIGNSVNQVVGSVGNAVGSAANAISNSANQVAGSVGNFFSSLCPRM